MNICFKKLLKEKLSEIIPHDIFRNGKINLVYSLNDTGYVASKSIDIPIKVYLDYFSNSIIEGELYDSEFNAFCNTYLD